MIYFGHVVQAILVVGLAAVVILEYRAWKKQRRQRRHICDRSLLRRMK